MKTRSLLLLTVVVVALFLFILLYEQHQPSTDEKKVLEKKVFPVEEGEVTRVEIQRRDETLILARGKDAWRIQSPVDAPAEESTVTAFLGVMCDLEKLRVLEDVSEEEYGLADPRYRVILKTTEGEHELSIGKRIPASETQAVKASGRKGILIVTKQVLTETLKPLNDFRRKQIFDVEPPEVHGVVITRGKERIVFARENRQWYIKEPLKDRAMERKVTDILYSVSGLNAKRFIDELEPERLNDVGLEDPRLFLSLTDQDGRPIVECSLGRKEGAKEKTFAVRHGQRAFVCEGDLWSQLMETPSGFVDDKILAFETWSVKKITVTAGGRSYSLTRSEEDFQWLLDDQALSAESDPDGIPSSLSAIADQGRVEERMRGKEQGSLTLVGEEGQTGMTVYSLKGDSDHLLAEVPDRPGLRKFSTFEWDGIVNTLETLHVEEAGADSDTSGSGE